MQKTLYLDCSSGIAGDMLVAALLDLGANELGLKAMLNNLTNYGLEDFDVEISRVKKHGIDACDFNVILDESLANHDHDMAWLHPSDQALEALDVHSHEHAHEHEHEHEHTHEIAAAHEHPHVHKDGHEHEDAHDHAHAHSHGHEHTHEHTHEHRSLADVLAIVEKADISRRAREIARRTFEILAKAEAKAHGTTMEFVHFHEVGAVDSVVDVLAAAFCLDNLQIDQVIVESLTEGSGTIRCAHGMMPIPVPATANIVVDNNIALNLSSTKGELVTPTGAALVAAIRTSSVVPHNMRIERIGVGAGKRDYSCPGIVRAMLIETEDNPAYSATQVNGRAYLKQSSGTEQLTNTGITSSAWSAAQGPILKLEFDVDDCSGEVLAFCMSQLLEAGALEVHYLPILTKKNRPAWQVQVLCAPELRGELERIIFADTTTIGLRYQLMERSVLARKELELDCEYGRFSAKAVLLPDGAQRSYPEYEAIAELARNNKLNFQQVLRAALGACEVADAERAARA